jgi:hypothetical protein
MGTSRLNVWLRDYNCVPLTNCWLLDLVVQYCNGTPLYSVFPLLEQLKSRYATPASAVDLSNYPLPDQAGRYITITTSTSSLTLNITTSCSTKAEIFNALKAYFTNVNVNLDFDNDQIVLTTLDKGPSQFINIDTDSDIQFSTSTPGSGYEISTRYYHGAYRIKIYPPAGQYINHVELDVPPGCYRIWARCCHGKNEETSTVMLPVESCGTCYSVNLILPEVMNCSQNVIYPLMDKLANDYVQAIPEMNDQALVFRGVALIAGLGREQILNELEERKQDAILINRTDLAERVDTLINIAQLLPTCL